MSIPWILCNSIALSFILSVLWLIEIRKVWMEHRVQMLKLQPNTHNICYHLLIYKYMFLFNSIYAKKWSYSPCFMVNIICSSANATPAFEGRGGEELGTEISNSLATAYQSPLAFDLTALCILPGQQCWKLYVDILVCLSYFFLLYIIRKTLKGRKQTN